MKAFLEYVADDLLEKYGDDLSQLTVVFPNKRASLFLNSYLARRLGKPIWSPRYTTISDLFREHTTLELADPIKLVCELHKSYVAVTGIDETLDHFYGWGQLLLSDFDDIDKQMADADKLLANLRDLHEMDDTDYLTEEQKAVIKKFFSNFTDDHTSLLKERFLKLWSRLADIYHDFNRRLSAQGLAYEGALYRAVVDGVVKGVDSFNSINSINSFNSFNSFIFIGFNVLQEVERRLFTYLKKEGKARFYWDFDRFYMKDHEAGHYIRQNLADFPNELDNENADIYDCFRKEKSISFVSAPTENVQARYVSQWLRDGVGSDGVRTAIVLCDEHLLPMVVRCLPAEAGKANITTGYPLIQSPVASLITLLFNLQTQGYQPNRERYRLRHVNALLRHPYIGGLSPEIPQLQKELNTRKIYYPIRQQLMVDEATSLLFSVHSSQFTVHSSQVTVDRISAQPNSQLSTLNSQLLQWMCDVLQFVARSMAREPQSSVFEQESLFYGYTLLNRLLGLVNDGDLQVDIITLQRLVNQLIQMSSIPFHGEPAEGVQVMGVLETRNLDFDHVLLLSCNEGNMPRGVNDTSFIPYNIRKAYGLTTIDHQVAIFSYYFHRLLQRASDITLLYNNATTDGHTGEMSRFMLQLMVEDQQHQIAFKTLRAGQSFIPFRPQPVEKTDVVMQRLISKFTVQSSQCTVDRSTPPLITPTAINRYMRCPLLFYYTYVYNLREPDINDDDTIDNRIFGNIFHEAARLIYTRLMEKSHQILATDIEWLLKTKADIERAVDEAIRTELFSSQFTVHSSQFTVHSSQFTVHSSQLPELNGLQLINRAVIIHYLRQLLDIDRRLAPFTIVGLETDVVAKFTVHSSQFTVHSSTIGGRIDRLDRIVKDGKECVRVIDYKTGNYQPRPLSGVEAIFRQESLANHSDYYLQTLLYSCLVSAQQQQLLHTDHPLPVAPALLFIQHAGGDDYDPILKFGKEPISDIAAYRKEFGTLLRLTLGEMFNPDIPFVPTEDKSRCTNCPYKMLCF